jgi:hypothetical protein
VLRTLVGKSEGDVGVRKWRSYVLGTHAIKAYLELGVYLHSF